MQRISVYIFIYITELSLWSTVYIVDYIIFLQKKKNKTDKNCAALNLIIMILLLLLLCAVEVCLETTHPEKVCMYVYFVYSLNTNGEKISLSLIRN